MSQQEVVVSLEVSGKIGLKAALLDMCKDGGAIDLEIKELEATLPFGLGGIIGFAAKKFLQSIAEKM